MHILSDHAALFLSKGIRPATSRAQNALLDELRSTISTPQPENCPLTPEALDRLERSSKAAKAAQEKQLEATKAAHEHQRQQRLAIERRIKSAQAAKHRAATSKPAAPAPVSLTPLADQLAKLQGAEATRFYRSNANLLRREEILARHPETILPKL